MYELVCVVTNGGQTGSVSRSDSFIREFQVTLVTHTFRTLHSFI
jgi:hypothetical protein